MAGAKAGGSKLGARWLDASVDRDRARWTAALGRCAHDFHHLPEYVALEAERLGGRGGAMLVEGGSGGSGGPALGGGSGVGLLPLIVRPVPEALAGGRALFDASSPYGYPAPVFSPGPPGFAAAATRAMVEGLREQGVVAAFVRLHPLLDAPLDTCAALGVVVDHGPTVIIDLEASEDEQWANYRGTHRNLIRRAKREGLAVRFDDDFAELDAFFSVYAETMERLDASWADMGRSYLEGFAAALGARAFLALVEHEGQVIAGGVFTRCDGIVQYHLSGTASAWQRASPSRLMLDEVRRRCAALGDRRMHLGGGVGAKEDALFRFKRGFSKDRGQFRSWRVTPDAEAYAELVEAWRAAGGDSERAGEFFPRYRAPVS